MRGIGIQRPILKNAISARRHHATLCPATQGGSALHHSTHLQTNTFQRFSHARFLRRSVAATVRQKTKKGEFMSPSLKLIPAVAILAGSLGLGGCATKGYVNEQIATVNQRIDGVEGRLQATDGVAQAARSEAQAANAQSQTNTQRLDQLTGRVDGMDQRMMQMQQQPQKRARN
jgi:murein lipoprotein